MKTTNNTVLIIGGSAGIGLEMARLFSLKGNQVIITGRDRKRLDDASATLPNVTTIVSDVSDAVDTAALIATIKADFPQLNIVVNNAAAASLYSVVEPGEDAFGKAAEEMHTNYLSIVRLTEKLLPVLKQQPEAAIINVSSIVALIPGALVGYSASKAALHSYTQSLRYALAQQYPSVKVFELMPPLVNTEFSKIIGGEKGIQPQKVAEKLLEALEDNTYEIHVGFTKDLYELSLSSPQKAFEVMHPVAAALQ